MVDQCPGHTTIMLPGVLWELFTQPPAAILLAPLSAPSKSQPQLRDLSYCIFNPSLSMCSFPCILSTDKFSLEAGWGGQERVPRTNPTSLSWLLPSGEFCSRAPFCSLRPPLPLDVFWCGGVSTEYLLAPIELHTEPQAQTVSSSSLSFP